MSVTTTNLIQGPATLYTGLYGATEPADSAVNSTPQASAWTDVGGTAGGVTLSIDQTYSQLEVDQVVDQVGSRLTKRMFHVETEMAEATLENLSSALNGSTAATGSGYKTVEPLFASSATQPTYGALLLDGWGANSFRRRAIVRKTLSVDPVATAYTKDKQTNYKVKWMGHYVSSTIAPLHIVEATS